MNRGLLKNKIYAVALLLYAVFMTWLLEGDITFLILAVLIGAVLFISKEPLIVDDDWEE